MKIVIGGAGEIGEFLCTTFVNHGYDVVVIDKIPGPVCELQGKRNISVVIGDIQDANVITQAGIRDCDFFLSVTDNTSANIISASMAKEMGAKNSIARTDSPIFSSSVGVSAGEFSYRKHFNIDVLIEPSAICAMEFAKIIRNPGVVAMENIAGNQIEIHRFNVNSASKWINCQIRDVSTGPGIRIISVNHDGIDSIPTPDTIIADNDVVTLAGKHEDIFRLAGQLHIIEPRTTVGVTIFGASHISSALARYLKSPRYKIRIIEESLMKCEQLAAEFPNITVVHGDAATSDLLIEEQVAIGDYFVACSDDDEKNTMVAIQAKYIGVNHVMLALNDGKYESVLLKIKDSLNITKIASKRISTARELANYVSDKNYNFIESISNEDSSFIEFKIAPSSEVIGKAIKNLGLPKGCVLVSLMRMFDAKIPSADDVILSGDRIVAAVKNEIVKNVIEIFSPK